MNDHPVRTLPPAPGRPARRPRRARPLAPASLLVPALLLAGVIAGLVAGCAVRPAAVEAEIPAAPAVCTSCFWDHQPAGLRREIARYYETHPKDDPVVQADIERLVGRIKGDGRAIRRSFASFQALRGRTDEPHRRLFVDEALAFMARECGHDPSPWFRRASASARAVGQQWKADVYRALARGGYEPQFAPASLPAGFEVPDGTRSFILGASVIRVADGWQIGSQMERTVRDWLSFQMAFDFRGRERGLADLLDYHEGGRMRQIVEAHPAAIVPLTGTLAARKGDVWYAPDETGVFRFEVLLDKIQYPTTRVHGNLALIVDTHGVSSVVEQAVRTRSNLVVACGDSPDKMKAAVHLARRGINVYFPCDRHVGEVIGYEGGGTLIGSGPVRNEGGTAVIGDRPLVFSVAEPIVVEDTERPGVVQYADAPARYFRRLSEKLPLRLHTVAVTDLGQAAAVVEKAVALGASAIGVRVHSEADYAAVRDWLAGSPLRRAVLFHSAPYYPGVQLFAEFPAQTTFGDPRPRFLRTELTL